MSRNHLKQKYTLKEGYTGVSRWLFLQLVCWWNVVSQTPPTVSK